MILFVEGLCAYKFNLDASFLILTRLLSHLSLSLSLSLSFSSALSPSYIFRAHLVQSSNSLCHQPSPISNHHNDSKKEDDYIKVCPKAGCRGIGGRTLPQSSNRRQLAVSSRCANQTENTAHAAYRMLLKAEGTDCKITCQGYEWNVHSLIVCAKSEYLARAFNGRFAVRVKITQDSAPAS